MSSGNRLATFMVLPRKTATDAPSLPDVTLPTAGALTLREGLDDGKKHSALTKQGAAQHGSTQPATVVVACMPVTPPLASACSVPVAFDPATTVPASEVLQSNSSSMDSTVTSQQLTSDAALQTLARRRYCRDISEYKILSHLGSGRYGSVSKAMDPSGRIVAVKQLLAMDQCRQGVGVIFQNAMWPHGRNIISASFPLQFPLTTVREFQALKTLRHDNIVKLVDVCCTPSSTANNMIGEVYMVFEYCDADLGGVIVKEKVMHDDYIRCFMHQLLSALVYMHQHGWVHRDLKPPNILLTKGNTLKVADLGLVRSTVTCKKMTPMVCTLWYRAPELLLQDPSAREGVDVWSVGCIFAEMLLGEPIFRGENEQNQIAQIYRLCGVPNKEWWPAVASLPSWKLLRPNIQHTPQFASKFVRVPPLARDLVEKLLAIEPARRISAADALKHPYFVEGDGVRPPSQLPPIISAACHFQEVIPPVQIKAAPPPAKGVIEYTAGGFKRARERANSFTDGDAPDAKRPRENGTDGALTAAPRAAPKVLNKHAAVQASLLDRTRSKTLVGGALARDVAPLLKPAAPVRAVPVPASSAEQKAEDDDMFI